ncbi:DUF6279 family lipoprotein [Aeromonas encheleia]|jgi:hypothetical protein|uniref:DUF6279 family lipoprotein n=1 Tax=Aeromonas encheleia TaxID=73010 RepID=UPI001F57C2F0|nr:DUF6279 family lipoprotein [Aeromonas encheleia]UNP90514.1 DUF6279 family lipoprotein [Aeromonas encheleia]
MVTTFSWRQPRSWSLLLLCLLLTGCATRVIYYWLDSAIVWQLDDYFSLDRSQKKLLDSEVKGLMAWHRQHELPIYARDLDALAKAVASPMSPVQVEYHLDKVQGSLTRTLENAIPRTVRLARTLTDAQVAHFMTDRVKRQQERQHDFATESREEMLKGFREKMNERLRFWIGRVKPAQEPLIAQWAEWQYEMMGPWLEFQGAWSLELDRLMKQRQSPDFGKELTRLLQQGDGLMDGRFTGYTDQSRQRTIKWLSDLSQSMDLSQRAHLYSLLKDYAEDFAAMTKGS